MLINWLMDKGIVDRYTAEYYSSITKNEILFHVTTCMQLEIIMLNEINQTKTNATWSYSHLALESVDHRMMAARSWAVRG